MRTPRIKFSHDYTKLRHLVFTTVRRHTPRKEEYYRKHQGDIFDVCVEGELVDQARLLQVLVVAREELSESFIRYDTDDVYTLPRGKLLLLIFKRMECVIL